VLLIWNLGVGRKWSQKKKKENQRAEMVKSKTKKGKRTVDRGFDLPPSGKDDGGDIKDMVGTVKAKG
jgi:hypothetical protein